MMSWINTLPEVLSTNHGQFIMDFLEWVVDPLLEFVRKNCKVRTQHVFRSCHGSVLEGLGDCVWFRPKLLRAAESLRLMLHIATFELSSGDTFLLSMYVMMYKLHTRTAVVHILKQ